jgi:eukaryotic translation initiation factor 2C
MMNYPGSMRLQAGGQEEIDDMYGMVKERLRAWSKNNKGALPGHVLFYRDGLSESQFRACEEHEIAAVKRAYAHLCTELKQEDSMKLTFVIVGKRHHTRFYPTNAKDTINVLQGKENSNLQPGLYVDHVVTDPSRFNFYLQSHQAIQGTARSAHYHVLVDEIGFGSGKALPNVTHALCYSFARATKGVSYVAPAYIADRLCERGRVYLREWAKGDGFGAPPAPKANETKEESLRKWKKICAQQLARKELMPITAQQPMRQQKTETQKLEEQKTGQQPMKRKVWGQYNDDQSRGEVRMNPWHSNLDMTMFWM